MKKINYAILGLFTLLFASCSSNKLDVNIDDVQVEINYLDWVSDLSQNNDSSSINQMNQTYKNKLNRFYEYYLQGVLKTGPANSKGIENRMMLFAKDRYIKQLSDEILAKQLMQSKEESITNSFKRLKFHLPEAKLPQTVVFWNSLFMNSVVSSDSCIGIGAERYIEGSKLYDSLPSPPHYQYLKEKYNSKFLESDVAKSWLQENILSKDKRETFLDELIFQGKLMYLTQAMLPSANEGVILRMNDKDVAWVQEKERVVWEYLVKNNIVYSTDPNYIRDFFNVAPFTNGLPEKAPGQVGNYVGWMIVKSFMEENSNYTIQNLVQESNTQKILKAYKINE